MRKAATTLMCAAAVVTAAALAATPAGAVASRAGTQHWAQVTPNGTTDIADIGLADGAHGTLNVLWASGGTSGGHAAIWDTPVSASGSVGHRAAVITGQFLVTDPDATVGGHRVDAVWNGIVSNTGATGTFLSSRPIAGGSWSAPVNVPPLPGIPFTSGAVSATTGADGKAWVAFTGTDSLTVDHFGQPEREIPPSACCVYNTGLAVDGHSKVTWIAYQSLISRHGGIYAQRLANSGAAAGARQLLPGSASHGNSAPIPQRVGITGRGTGRSGVYVAYRTGYPTSTGVALLRLGDRKAVKLAAAPGGEAVAGTTVTADSAGGLWVAWFYGDGTSPGLFVRQSNSAVSKFGRATRVGLPSGTTVVWKVYISAVGRKLDVVALLTRHNKIAYWVTTVR